MPLAIWLFVEPAIPADNSQALFALYGTLITAAASIGVAFLVNQRANRRGSELSVNPSPDDVPIVLGYYQDCRRDLEARDRQIVTLQHRIAALEDELDEQRSLSEFLLRKALHQDGET